MPEEKNPSILILDDEEDIRDYLKRFLERHGYIVFTAADAEEGLKIAEEKEINIVLADIVMPKMDGITFLNKVRTYNPEIEVVMITGFSTFDRCTAAFKQGACGYLLKPINNDDILNGILRARNSIKERRDMVDNALSWDTR